MRKLNQSLFSSLSEKFMAGLEQRKLRRESIVASEQLRQQRIGHSPQFANGRVINRLPKVASNESMSQVMKTFFFGRSALKPNHALPYQPIDVARFEDSTNAPRVTWLGHSSLFIELDQTKILLDPVFDYASPWFAKRLFSRNVSAPIARKALPKPDVIVISHDHYDHLEQATVEFYAQQEVTFVVPLAVGRHLEKWGVKPNNIIELDWWQSTTINTVELTAAPANHNSGRTGFDSNSTLWASWAIKGVTGSLFYSGDTAYDAHFKQIGEQLGPFDLAFVEVAANVKQGKGYPVENWGHMQARHTAQAFLDLNAKRLMPVHWSTYELFAHRWDEPMQDLLAEAAQLNIALVTPMVGESIELNDSIDTKYWWLKRPEMVGSRLDYQMN